MGIDIIKIEILDLNTCGFYISNSDRRKQPVEILKTIEDNVYSLSQLHYAATTKFAKLNID